MPRLGRVLDVVGLVVFLAGSAIVARAWLGFHEVQAFQPTAADGPMAAVELANGFWRLQKVGVGLMLAGVAVFVAAWWTARRARTLPDRTPGA